MEARILLLLVVVLLSGCGEFLPAPIKKNTWCESPRVKVCTMDYKPVCGKLLTGQKRDYSSPCNACADDNVSSYSEGACEMLLQ